MISGTPVRFRKKLVLSLLVPIFLIGWAIVPMNANAFIQQAVSLSNNGTVYQYICYDGNPPTTSSLRVTNASMAIAFNAATTVTGTATQGTTLVARVPASPLVPLASANKVNFIITPVPLACPPNITFVPTGGGTWSVGTPPVLVTSGFGGANQAAITSGLGIPAAQVNTNIAECGSNVYGFGTASPTCSTAQGGPQPGNGFTLTNGQGVLFIYNGNSFISGGGSLNVAGGGAGFDGNGNAEDATADQDTTLLVVTTTSTSTSTSSSTTTSSTTSTSTSTSTTTSSTTSTTSPKIPTAGTWGMIILGLAFMGSIAWMLRARRSLR